jgi:endonuclease/exonuclease/phosphatase (EEP) superfamily protein YafD
MRRLGFLLALMGCGGKHAPPQELRLVTYNLNFGNPDVERTMDAIAATNPDVALLQEVTPGWEALLRKRFGAQFPHVTFHLPGGGHAGHAVLSRFRLTTDELLSKPEGAFYHGQRMVLATPSGPLQILHIHLRASIDDDCFRGPCSHLHWVKGQFTTPPIRRREIEAHWKRVDRTLPTIVAGDFNEPAEGDVVAFLTRHGLTRVPTTGPPTWHYVQQFTDGHPQDLLKETIDHVMIDNRIDALDATVLDAGASDHRPVIARLRLREMIE